MPNTRSFRITSVSQDDNVILKENYWGRDPNQAARKAFTGYCKKAGIDSCRRKFTLKETTAGSKGKELTYVGTRRRLEKPKEFVRDGKPIKVHYEISVYKAD